MTNFLDADDKHWILAHDHREIVDVLPERIDVDDDDHFLMLTAACFEHEEDAAMQVEK